MPEPKVTFGKVIAVVERSTLLLAHSDCTRDEIITFLRDLERDVNEVQAAVAAGGWCQGEGSADPNFEGPKLRHAVSVIKEFYDFRENVWNDNDTKEGNQALGLALNVSLDQIEDKVSQLLLAKSLLPKLFSQDRTDNDTKWTATYGHRGPVAILVATSMNGDPLSWYWELRNVADQIMVQGTVKSRAPGVNGFEIAKEHVCKIAVEEYGLEFA